MLGHSRTAAPDSHDVPRSTMRGHELHEAACTVLPGGVNSATRYIGPPYAFASGNGAYVVDVDGNRYVDFHAAFGAVLLGHKSCVRCSPQGNCLPDHYLTRCVMRWLQACREPDRRRRRLARARPEAPEPASPS